LNTAEQLNIRRNDNRNLDSIVIDDIQTMLLDTHLYIDQYCYAYKLIRKKPVDKQQEIRIRLYVDLQHDPRTYNLPTIEEIAVIILEKEVYYTMDNRDVVLQTRGE